MNKKFIKRGDLLLGAQFSFSEKLAMSKTKVSINYENSVIDDNGYIQLCIDKFSNNPKKGCDSI